LEKEEKIMQNRNLKTLFTMAGAMMIILACGLPTSTEPTTVAPPSQVPTEVIQVAAEVSASPTEISTPSIQHQTIPVGLPEKGNGQAGDFNSSTTLENKTVIGGDRFTYGRFERPFNANTMDVYFSQIDIIDTSVSEDDIWIFGTIKVQAPDASNALSGKYALELDTNLDGKGDWLIVASNPTSTDWGVEGVQVFQDANHDVGGEMPTLTDTNPVVGDGFESVVFDQGQGDDADSAWMRISPNDPNSVEIAVKKSVLGDSKKYLINMWAGNSLLDPALFDFNDHFSHEQAGAADRGLEYYYPIKEVYEIDSSCRMAVGFQPTGKEPGLCEVLVPDGDGGYTEPSTGCSLTANSCRYGFDPVNCCCRALTYVGCLP
jgi:hypothetical protein